LRGLLEDRFARGRIVWLANRRIKNAQIVVYFRSRRDGRTGVASGRTLLDGDGRREPFNEIDIGLLHLVEKLPGVGRKALDVTALALGVKGIEGKGGFARTAQAGHHDQLLARDFQRQIFEIMLSRACDFDCICSHFAG